MPDIEEDLIISIKANQVRLVTCCGDNDILEIKDLNLSDSNAATLAWIINHPSDTDLELQLKITP